MRYEVKELTVGGILDQAIRFARDNFKFLAIIAVIPFVPNVIFTMLTLFVSGDVVPIDGEEIPPDAAFMFTPTGIIIWLLSMLVMVIMNALCTGACALGIADRYLGSTISAGECMRGALARIGALIGTAIVTGIAMMIGFLLLIVPGVLLMLGWAIVYPVLMFEGLGAFEAMSRSRKLMVGHKGKALVLMFLVGIASLCLGVIAGIVPNYYFSALVQQAFSSLAIVFNSVVVTVLYFSARCHAENFDLELLAEMVESKAPVPEAAL